MMACIIYSISAIYLSFFFIERFIVFLFFKIILFIFSTLWFLQTYASLELLYFLYMVMLLQ